MVTPFAYEYVLDCLMSEVRLAMEDAHMAPANMAPANTDAFATYTIKMMLVSYCAMSMDDLAPERDLEIHALYDLYQSFARSRGSDPFIGAYLTKDTYTTAVQLECGGDQTCLELDTICETYQIMRQDAVVPNATTTPSRVRQISLPPTSGIVRMRLKQYLRSMYAAHVRYVLATAFQQNLVRCKIPLCQPNDVPHMRETLAQDDSWEDASLYLILSSDDTLLTTLLKAWPFASEYMEHHIRKLNHFRTLLRTNNPILDLNGVISELSKTNHDYLSIFFNDWGRLHMKQLRATLYMTNIHVLQAFHEVCGDDADAVEFSLSRMSPDNREFKDMLRFLITLPKNRLTRCDMDMVRVMNNHDLYRLVTL